MDFAISLYAVFLLLLFKATPKVGDASIFGFRKLTFIIAAAELPYLFALNHDRDALHPFVLTHITDFELTFIKFLALKSLFLVTFSITAFHLQKNGSRSQSRGSHRSITASLDLHLSLLMLFLTLLTFVLLVSNVGGLSYLLLNWSNKTAVLQGTAIYRIANFVFGLLSVGFFINYIANKKRTGVFLLFWLFLIITAVFLILLSVGERKNPTLLILYSIIAWHYQVAPIRIVAARNFILLIFFMVFAALFPELRNEGATKAFFYNPAEILVASTKNWSQLFARLSDAETSLFIYSHFDEVRKFWFGATWPDLLTGIIPSSMLSDKPPIDEGVYIYNLAHYQNISPPVPFRELIPVGWPLSRVTGPYVHFGVLGVLIGGLITGWLMGLMSKITFKSRSPTMLLVYIWSMFTGFGLTNAFIFYFTAILVLLWPVHWFHQHRVRKLRR